MPLSMYELSVPVFLRGVEIAHEYCDKAAAFASSHGIDPSALVNARLAPDMPPYAGQIQRISDASKGPIGRLAAIVPPSFEDTEQTFPELKARLKKTSAFLRGIKQEQLIDSEARTIEARLEIGETRAGCGAWAELRQGWIKKLVPAVGIESTLLARPIGFQSERRVPPGTPYSVILPPQIRRAESKRPRRCSPGVLVPAERAPTRVY